MQQTADVLGAKRRIACGLKHGEFLLVAALDPAKISGRSGFRRYSGDIAFRKNNSKVFISDGAGRFPARRTPPRGETFMTSPPSQPAGVHLVGSIPLDNSQSV